MVKKQNCDRGDYDDEDDVFMFVGDSEGGEGCQERMMMVRITRKTMFWKEIQRASMTPRSYHACTCSQARDKKITPPLPP